MYTPKKATAAFVLFLVNAIALTVYGKELANFSSQTKPDFMFSGYNAASLNELFTEYGSKGRSLYRFLTSLDLPFPFVLFLFCLIFFRLVWRSTSHRIVGELLLVPVVIFVLTDCVENYAMLSALATFPSLDSQIIQISSMSTQIKLISLGFIYFSVIVSFLYFIFFKIKRRHIIAG